MNTLETIATMIAGMGLFFGGLRILSNSLKNLATHKFRLLVARWTGNPFLSAFWGFVSGAVSQSSFSTVFILIGLVRSGLITVRKALPILSWSNIGITLLIFLVAINLKISIFMFVGLSGFLFGLHKEINRENLYKAFFGFSLLLFGYQLLKTGSQPFAQLEFINNLFKNAKDSYIIPIFIGFILRLLIHSSPAVTVLIMSFSHAGLIGLDQVIIIIFSMGLGEAATTILLSSGINGVSKQLVIFRVIESVSASVVLIAIFYIELIWHIPLVKQLLNFLSSNIAQQTAFTFLIAKVTPLFLLAFFYNPVYKILLKLSPPTSEEDLSKPRFITEQSLADTSTALLLIENEQTSIFERFSESIDNVRSEKEGEIVHDFSVIRKSNGIVISEIDMYMKRIIGFNLSEDNSEFYVQLQNRQNLLKSLDEVVYNFVHTIDDTETSGRLRTLMQTFAESLHINLITATEASKSKHKYDIDLLLKITDDKGALMEKIRRDHLVDNEDISAEQKAVLLYVTDLFQRTIWLLNNWAKYLKPEFVE